MAPAKLFLRLVSLLVPRDARPTWLAEWRAEIEHAWRVAGSRGEPGLRARARLTVRALGSASDALWLRWRHVSRAVPAETLRHAARGLMRRPAFALTVVLTLGLGVGASTAIFTVVDALLVRPLPFRAPHELVAISTGASPSSGLDEEALEVWRSQEVFSEVKARVARPVIVGGAGEARYDRAELVEPGFLALLGLRPALGRALTPDDATGDGRVVLLSDELWREGFGRDPDVVGRTVDVDGEPHTVVGVLPPELRRTTDGIVGLMMPLPDPPPNDRIYALGRLRSDVPLDVAQARLGEVARILSSERPREEAWQVRLWPLQFYQMTSEDLRRGLLALGAAVLCLLLVSYANAAGLLLMRGVSRRPEIRLRVALGASRTALVSQVLAESVLLAAGAGLVGTIFAWWGARGLVALLPSGAVRFSYNPISVDGRVLGFALFLTLVTGVAFGTLPAWRAARSAGQGTGRTTTSSRDAVRIRAGIHVAQLALALALVAAAGVFTGSFRRLMTADLGYDVGRVLQIHLVSLERLTGQEATIAFAAELDERLRALPGVAGVTRASGMGFTFDFTLETAEGVPSTPSPNMLPHMSVDTAYFRTMGISIVAGRGFTAGDVDTDAVVVDTDLAGALWPGAPAVGRRFRIDAGPWLTVVGVTADVKLEGPREPLGPYTLFYPAAHEALRNGMVVVRTSGDPATVAPAVRSLIRELDPDQPIGSVETGIRAVRSFVADPRLLAFIMSALAGAATFLAAVGVYGLVSFGVAQRRREIGVRMALGAPSGRVTVEVLRSGLALAVGGIGLGLVVTLIVSRPLAGLLYETSALDPKALALAAVTLLAATAVALVGPARRAAATDPAETLRDE